MAAATSRQFSLREALLDSVSAFASSVRAPFAPRPRPNPFLASGPAGERNLLVKHGHAPYGDPEETGLKLTVADVRRKLADLVSGRVRIQSLTDLAEYLRQNMFSLEIRGSSSTARGTAFVRNAEGSVPAAAVSPRLGARGLDRLAKQERAAGLPLSTAPRAAPSPQVGRYQDKLRVALAQRPPRMDYTTLRVGLPSALTHEEVVAWTVSDGVAYVGRPGMDASKPLECLASPDDTRTMILDDFLKSENSRMRLAAGKPVTMDARDTATFEAARASNFARFKSMPTERQDAFLAKNYVFDAGMGVRTMVLRRDRFLVKAAEIHPLLSATAVREHTGASYRDACASLHARLREQGASRRTAPEYNPELAAKVVDISARRRELGSRPVAAPSLQPKARPAAAERLVVVSDPANPGQLRVRSWSKEGGHRAPAKPMTLHELPPGNYPMMMEGDNRTSGSVQIDEDRGATFLDSTGREHSEDGPSHVPHPSNKKAMERWALDGEVMAREQWEATASSTVDEEPLAEASGFGFGGPPG